MSSELQSGVQMEAAAPVVNESSTHTESAPSHQESGLLSALQSERAQRQQLQEHNRMMQEHLQLLQANQYQPQPQQEPASSMNDNDVMTYGEFKRAASAIQNEVQLTVEQLRVRQEFPDYQEVVSKHLPEVIKQNPHLERTLKTSNDYGLAYHLAKTSESYRSEQKMSKRSADAERIIQNTQSAGSLASVGAASPVSLVKNYKGMTDADFLKEVQRNNAGY